MAFYPYVPCAKGKGHETRPGYAACCHVLEEAATVAHYEEAREDRMGVIACRECASSGGEMRVQDYWPICATCAEENGWVKTRVN